MITRLLPKTFEARAKEIYWQRIQAGQSPAEAIENGAHQLAGEFPRKPLGRIAEKVAEVARADVGATHADVVVAICRLRQ